MKKLVLFVFAAVGFLAVNLSAQNLPSRFDWRDYQGYDWTTPARSWYLYNDGSYVLYDSAGHPIPYPDAPDSTRHVVWCCAHESFAIIAVLEARWKIQQNLPNSQIDLSEAQLHSCYAHRDCWGLPYGEWLLLDTLMIKGVTTEKNIPFVPGQVDCSMSDFYQSGITYGISSYEWACGGVDAAKKFLTENGPLVASLYVCNWPAFRYYTGGVYQPEPDGLPGKTSLCLVGYDDADSCWICKNTTGPNWGENGYIRIPYYSSTFDNIDGDIIYFLELTPEKKNGIEEEDRLFRKPDETFLAYPNPFNSEVKFTVENGLIEIFDISGRKVDVVANSVWDASRFPSGIYFARRNNQILKLILIK